MTIQRNSRLFPFSRLVADTDESSQRRAEVEDAIAHLERQLDDVVEQVNNAIAASQSNDDILASIAELSTQLASVSANYTGLSTQIAALQSILGSFIDTNKVVTLLNNVPFLMRHYFSGSITIESGTTGFIPAGFQNDGLLVVNGTLRTI